MTAQADALMGIFGFKRVEGKAMDKVSDTRRGLFEAAYEPEIRRKAAKYGMLNIDTVRAYRVDDCGDYESKSVQAAWFGFNAALDAVEIVTPTNEFLSESFAYGVEQMIDAIESTSLGLRIK